jgi:hypothetical protein
LIQVSLGTLALFHRLQRGAMRGEALAALEGSDEAIGGAEGGRTGACAMVRVVREDVELLTLQECC